MPFVPVANTAMVEMRATMQGQHIENRVMVDALIPITPEILESIALTCQTWWEDEYAPLLSNQVSLVEVVATDLTSAEGPQVSVSPAIPTSGANSDLTYPNEVSLCISLRTGGRGRSARGRFYKLSLNQSQMSATNEVTAAHAAACVAALNGLRDAISTAGYNLIIVSYRHDNAPRPGGPVKFTVTHATVVDNIVDSMRRRKPGVGT